MKFTAVLASGLAAVAFALDLSEFDEAIRNDPRNHLAFYKRATANLAAGRDPQALGDLSAALDIDPEFTAARYYRAKLYLRMGNWDKCLIDSEVCSDKRVDSLVSDATLASQLFQSAEQDDQNGEYLDCISSTTQALKISPRAVFVRRLRYKCAMSAGEVPQAFADLQEIVSQESGDADATAKLAEIMFLFDNEREKALKLLRRCLNYDPDAKQCATASKLLRKLEKSVTGDPLKVKYKDVEAQVFSACDNLGVPRSYGETSMLLDELRHRRCEAYSAKEEWDRGAQVCARVRDTDPDFLPAVLLQAQLERQSGNLHGALRLLDPLIHHGKADDRVIQLYQEIQAEMQRPRGQTPTKDLYKVLGVDEKADKQEIKKAYRALSKQYHPDKYRGDELSADEVMAKMQEINEAYEVLSNEDTRKDYDIGRRGTGGASGGGAGFPPGFGGGSGGAGGMGIDIEQLLRQFAAQQGAHGGDRQGRQRAGGAKAQFKFGF
ncbi:DnaJ subfamily C member 3 [Wickerhamiella sorbophila]|uniref:DnaJ subfamily C member 3 n=1 Tax=Wickerhamiella sorbophila TaxID=45607 RepID=A0A2T0FC78_9ASCO|nr:DnaJ subfamily C member 3 [Wickerhamiella sorbophila]PRT52612.1 DnaJ subfamily C member 3 [Wickerhamiella sorbophila]